MAPAARDLLRFAVAAGVAGAVALIAILVAWAELGQEWHLNALQRRTQDGLERIGRAVETYREKTGSLPAALDDLPDMQQVHPVDSWRRPFLYSVQGTSYTLTSLGRDGKPGGVGIDCDLTHHDPNPPEAFPTLYQFIREFQSQGIVVTCLVAGFLAGVVTWLLAKPSRWTRENAVALVVGLVATVIGSVIVGALLAHLHIPTGH